MSEPRAFAAVDQGTASVSAALIGRVQGRWRLLGSAVGPVRVGADPLLARLVVRLGTADAGLAASLGLRAASEEAAADVAAGLTRLTARTSPPPRIVVLAASARVLEPLLAVAGASGWKPHGLRLDEATALDVAAALADPSVDVVLAGAGDPPGADERGLLPEITAHLLTAIQRRPSLTVVLSGGLAEPGGRAEQLLAGERVGSLVLGPSARAGEVPGAALRDLLDGLRASDDDGHRAMGRAAATLAGVLERRLEVVDVGQSAGTRIVVNPGAPGTAPRMAAATVPGAALVPSSVDDATVDAVAAWLTIAVDRLRLRDRLRELSLDPWADPAGDGALLRMAAARAALGRLVAATPWADEGPRAELLVASGGAWAVAPGPAVALALVDSVRRAGTSGLGLDHARLLGPIGMVEDPDERRALVADLRDDLIVPLGSVVMPAGMRAGGPGGTLTVHAAAGPAQLDLVPGGLELVDLPPGDRATIELRFKDPVDVGVRGRHFAVEVSGGLGGLLVDLRDVPLRLPDRPDRRRDILASWQSALWTGIDG